MRKESKVPVPVTTIGISSLLVVFIILCLVTFACLSLSTAKSDLEFAKKTAEHKTEYYRACNEAEEKINDRLNGRSQDNSWTIEINDRKALAVDISPAGGNGYSVTRWLVVSTVQHDYNKNMNLIQ